MRPTSERELQRRDFSGVVYGEPVEREQTHEEFSKAWNLWFEQAFAVHWQAHCDALIDVLGDEIGRSLAKQDQELRKIVRGRSGGSWSDARKRAQGSSMWVANQSSEKRDGLRKMMTDGQKLAARVQRRMADRQVMQADPEFTASVQKLMRHPYFVQVMARVISDLRKQWREEIGALREEIGLKSNKNGSGDAG